MVLYPVETEVWCGDLNCKFNTEKNICNLTHIKLVDRTCQNFKQAKITLVSPYKMVIREEEK